MYKSVFDRYLKYFEKEYTFGFCKLNEIDEVISFIDLYWKKDHALVRSRTLLDWQHRDEAENRYNFSVARHKKSGEIHAILGFIPTSLYDKNIKDVMAWGALWKSREDVAMPGLGVMVEDYYLNNVGHRFSSGMSFTQDNIKIHKSRKDILEYMNRFYIINDKVNDYELCIPEKNKLYTPGDSANVKFTYIDSKTFDELNGGFFIKAPVFKSKRYYINRYYNHPVYNYSAIGIADSNGDVKAVLFIRFCENNGKRCIRIVDYIGDGSELKGSLHNFKNLLYETNSEFIDFIEYGLNKNDLSAGGFVDINDSKSVLAHYFEPFELRNRDIIFSIPHEEPDYPIRLFKGDADQDRPNIITKEYA